MGDFQIETNGISVKKALIEVPISEEREMLRNSFVMPLFVKGGIAVEFLTVPSN